MTERNPVAITPAEVLQRKVAAVAEGFCPDCRLRLTPLSVLQQGGTDVVLLSQQRGRPSSRGYCRRCRMCYVVVDGGLLHVSDLYLERLLSAP